MDRLRMPLISDLWCNDNDFRVLKEGVCYINNHKKDLNRKKQKPGPPLQHCSYCTCSENKIVYSSQQ